VSLAEFITESTQKTRTEENFPVGSILIAPELRADVYAYYRFARLADDIADTPSMSSTQKIHGLNAMEAWLMNSSTSADLLPKQHQEASRDLGIRLRCRGLKTTLASDLLEAFRADARNQHCRTWADLVNYCQYSACPVGRFLLALHGEKQGVDASDALCSALQILNHIQDAKSDAQKLHRYYIPSDWLEHEGATQAELSESYSSAGVKKTLTRVLDQTAALLDLSAPLTRLIDSRRLATEAAVCISLAHSLLKRLRSEDPLMMKVSLSKLDWIKAGTFGLYAVLLR